MTGQVTPGARSERRGRKEDYLELRGSSKNEKARVWPKLTGMYRDFDDYQARTERNIPVIRLAPRGT